MPSFGNRSQAHLDTCHPDIQLVLNKAIEIVDFSVICGYRNELDQNIAYDRGGSTKQFPNSKHNIYPSPAVDIMPYYSDPNWRTRIWMTDKALQKAINNENYAMAKHAVETIKRWHTMIGTVIGVGHGMEIELISGGDWDKDFEFDDHRLIDLPHLQLK